MSKPCLQRNNTSFPTQLSAKLHALYAKYRALQSSPVVSEQKLWAGALKYYQYLVRAYVTDPDYGVGGEAGGGPRGIIVNHKMGYGKTRTAVALFLANLDRKVKFVAPRSLHKNFATTVREVVSLLNPALTGGALTAKQDEVLLRVTFVSSDAYNMAAQLERGLPVKGFDVGNSGGSLDGALVIVDEAHQLFRAIINSGSEHTNGQKFYAAMMAAKNMTPVFFTGTFPSKDPFELVPCFNMLAGRNLLPPLYETFERLYVDRKARRIKNVDKLKNRLVGMLSYVGPGLPLEPLGTKGFCTTNAVSGAVQQLEPNTPAASATASGFPERRPLLVHKLEMAPEQYRVYRLAREKEDAETQGAGAGMPGAEKAAKPLALPGAERRAARTYYVHSRAACNFVPPREHIHAEVEKMPDSAFTAATSPKAALMVKHVKADPCPQLIYSQFVDRGGLAVVARFLSIGGYERYTPEGGKPKTAPPAAPPAPKKRYAIISGETPVEDRDAIVRTHNLPENKHGELLAVVLVSKTGATGLDFKWGRAVHILEPYWDKSLEDQVTDRYVRLNSHTDLPAAERYVQPHLYITSPNRAKLESTPEKNRELKTIDEQFHERAVVKYEIIKDCRSMLQSVALECMVLGYGGCHMCMPTNAPLFGVDPAQDLTRPNPCQPLVEKVVEAKLVPEHAKFFYAPDPSSALGYRFFEHRADLGGHAPVDESLPIVVKLLEAVKKKS